MRRTFAFMLLMALAASAALSDPISERRFIREGMSEAEVLAKVGKPDSETFDTGNNATYSIKRWTYMPTSGDRQTITTVVIQQGQVISVDRKILP